MIQSETIHLRCRWPLKWHFKPKSIQELSNNFNPGPRGLSKAGTLYKNVHSHKKFHPKTWLLESNTIQSFGCRNKLQLPPICLPIYSKDWVLYLGQAIYFREVKTRDVICELTCLAFNCMFVQSGQAINQINTCSDCNQIVELYQGNTQRMGCNLDYHAKTWTYQNPSHSCWVDAICHIPGT